MGPLIWAGLVGKHGRPCNAVLKCFQCLLCRRACQATPIRRCSDADHSDVCHFLNHFYQFWFIKIPILLCDGPKPNISMISGFLTPGEPLFMDLIKYTKNTLNNKTKSWIIFGKYYFVNLGS